MQIQKHICKAMFIIALFSVTRKGTQPKCPLTDECTWGTLESESESHSVVSDSLRPHEPYSLWNSPGQNTRRPFPFVGDLPKPGIRTRFPKLKVDSLPSEPQGTSKNTGVGSLSLLQWIFPTQELNQDLLQFRQIFLPTELSGKTWGTLRSLPLPTGKL